MTHASSLFPALIGAALALSAMSGANAQTVAAPASAAEQAAALRSGAVTSEAIVRAGLARIEAVDRAGPKLNSILAVNPQALADARASDALRKAGRARGPLEGVSVVLKDNIELAGPLATTAGSLALADNITGRDAPLAARLKAGGMVVLGKANLSEWANFRSTRSVSGWSAAGGLVRNPYVLDRSACGSSAGSAAAVAAGIAAAAIGTETDGSITCPAAVNGLVGLKPTLGLVSRTYVVPLSPAQDTPGPMTHTVGDAAAVLNLIAGSDPADPATREADARKTDYVAALKADALRGARIGVMRGAVTLTPDTDALFERALASLRSAGAVLVDVKMPNAAQRDEMGNAEGEALRAEFRAAIDQYLATAAPKVASRTLADLVAFNASHPVETALFGQETFEAALKSPALTDPAYLQLRATALRLAGSEGLDRMMAEANVEAIVAPTGAPAPVVDPINGSRSLGSPTTMPAIAGYPHLTVPMGLVAGLPMGLSFIGPKWSDARILSLGFAFEQTGGSRPAPAFLPTLAAQPQIARAYDIMGMQTAPAR
jgi:amidase